MNCKLVLVVGVVLGGLASACAGDTYYWLVGDFKANQMGDATDLANWSVQFDSSTKRPIADAHPTRLPTLDDTLCAYRDFFFDLNGGSIAFDKMNEAASADPYGINSWGSIGYCWQFTNGTFTVKTLNARIRAADHFTVWDGARFVCTDRFTAGDGMGGDGIMTMNVEPGGVFDTSAATYNSYNGRLNVKAGATAVLGTIGILSGTQTTSWIKNWGDCTLTKGIVYPSSTAAAALAVYQEAGTMTLGGPVSRNGATPTLSFAVNGGKLRTTDNVFFRDVNATVAAGLVLTTEVVTAGTTLNMTDVAFGANTPVVKTGPGAVAFGTAWPVGVTVEEGFLKFVRNSFTCPIVPVIGANGGLLFGAKDTRLDEVDIAEGASFALDLSAVTIGDTILLSSSDELLNTVCAGLNAWCVAERVTVGVKKTNGALEITARAEHTFDATSGKSLSDPTGWGEDEVPAGASVDVAGAGVVDISDDTPAFASIRVRDGATLRVVGGAADALVRLPSVQLVGNARLLVAGGAFAELKPGEDLATTPAEDGLPVFEVATNGYVYVSGVESAGPKEGSFRNDICFKNVDMRICGKLETPIAYLWSQSGDPDWPTRYVYLNLGYAEQNETARFALTCDGGTISLRNYSWNYGYAFLRIAYATSDGRVAVERPLVFRNCSFPSYMGPKGNRSLNALEVGVGNPSDEPVIIEAERTVFDVTDTSKIGGGVDFRFGWGATLRRMSYVQTHGVNMSVADRAKLSFVGSDFFYGRVAPAQGREIDVSSAGIDGEVMSFTNANFATWRVRGNATPRKVTFADSRWYLGNWIIDQNLGSSGDPSKATYTTKPTDVFAGFSEASIPAGTTFTLLGTNYTWGSSLDVKKFTRMHWDRTIDFSPTAAITGGGNILVSNNAPTNSMTATLHGALNTCTGEIAAEPGTRSTLRIADGANWAGTVVANGCASLFATNALGVAVPAKASFGSIRFDGVFPIRVWREGGVLIGDGVDLARAVSGTGAFEVVCADGCSPELEEGYEFGRYPADAALPRVRPGKWSFVATPTDDPAFVNLRLEFNPKGVLLILR